MNHEFLKSIELWLSSELGNSQKTINNKIGFIQAVLNFSLEMKRIFENPSVGYRKTKASTKDIEFLERDEAHSFLGFLNARYPSGSEERWRYTACFLTVNTGLRAGELWGLKGFGLKSARNFIRVTQQWNRVSKSFEELKGKRPRSVPLNSEVLKELEAHSHDRNISPSDLLFSVKGEPVDHDAFKQWFDREIGAWKGRRITFHGLRHTAATLMLEAGVNVKKLQAILGHADINTTMRYVHCLSTDIGDVAKIFAVSPLANPLKIVN